MKRIETVDELRQLIGEPHSLVQHKISPVLTPEARDFISRSPLLFMATKDDVNRVTVSPKGDVAGFVRVGDEHTLLIPERPGNKLCHGLGNILRTGSVGLLFTLPGTEETLRVNGRAQLYEDDETCGEMSANGKPALLLIRVEVEECFFHCAKAFKRSKSWQPETWQQPLKVNFGKQIARNSGRGKVSGAAVAIAVDAAIKADYKNNL
ncbi:pyridoxamine 5'-phosphate oxidase family protein [Pseudohalioglobus sediminis]|uniref:Pyridoxamine 5'-phosphate oxidase family protein n=1 Tax=Pseudohalioglobus sediminis TaxID=2606449 RepID=A0A5B0X123_9GAMM|nr:MSMEG_1061 family FMN-dependent PPOX-type flavoprotein [Pseudohalioglobus sediminis]KAA1193020.1 pyridoxamine 5'-phosphate oxidase family protein [Pseudohalioglobus sediminis]